MIKLGKYRHYKGTEYEVLGIAVHTETNEEMVLYKVASGPYFFNDWWKNNWEDGKLYVRPSKMFFDKVVFEGVEQLRFTKID